MVAPRLLAVSCSFAAAVVAAVVSAEPLTYHLTDPAQKYVIDVLFTQSFDGAPAAITLKDKAGGQVLQRIESTEAFGLFKPESQNGQTLAYTEQSLLVFGDFNFDGQQDLAVRNGNDAGYGGPSYDIYLFDPESPTLVLNNAFSDLTREPQLGLFGIDIAGKRLLTQSKSGCCWHQSATWEIQGNTPVMLTENIKVAQMPSEATPLMPLGYTDITDRELKHAQWTQTRRLEGPVGEAPVMLRGTVDGKIAVELWWQVQGAAYVGEVRYPKSGSGKPIRLIGGPYDDGGVQLHELDDAGGTTGTWYLEGTPDAHGFQSGTWHGPGEWILSAKTRPTAFKVADAKLHPVVASQREGRYVVNNSEEPRVGELILKIVTSTDNSATETADIRMNVRIANDRVLELHEQYPLMAGNLIIAKDDKDDFIYRLQVLNGAIKFDAFGDNYQFSSAFVKQNNP
ncbi:XAC2610-related protein [Pseudomonas sp. S2_A02]|jgi:hypothetical protein